MIIVCFTDVITSLNSINFDTDKSMYTYEDKREFFLHSFMS